MTRHAADGARRARHDTAAFVLQFSLHLCLVLCLCPSLAAAKPWCLPPVYDHGKRLHALPNPEVYWLEIMMRQHELCWREPKRASELRVGLFGSSAVYGFPLPVEETFGEHLNAHFAGGPVPAHLFNLALVTPYQIRDAVMINESLAYAPDVIVYPITLAEFRHIAPMPFPTFTRFFNMNVRALQRLTEAPPAGLEEPFANYGQWIEKSGDQRTSADQLRDSGLFVRELAHSTATAVAAQLNSPPRRFVQRKSERQDQYDCEETRLAMTSYRSWNEWNILAYLEDLQRRSGIRVLVVHWPIAHEPIDDCYSVRYTKAKVEEFSAWIREQTTQRQLAYLDLRDLIDAQTFIDSIHISPAGHKLIADRIAEVIDPILQATAERATKRAH